MCSKATTRVGHTNTCVSARSHTFRVAACVRRGRPLTWQWPRSVTVSRLCQHRGRGEPSPVKGSLLSWESESAVTHESRLAVVCQSVRYGV